jgi:hypothetical protein
MGKKFHSFTLGGNQGCIDVLNNGISSLKITKGSLDCVVYCPENGCKSKGTLECKKFDSDNVANVGDLNDQIVSFGICPLKEPKIVIKTFLDFDFGSNFNIYNFKSINSRLIF